jgi:hypothetical protein
VKEIDIVIVGEGGVTDRQRSRQRMFDPLQVASRNDLVRHAMHDALHHRYDSITHATECPQLPLRDSIVALQ